MLHSANSRHDGEVYQGSLRGVESAAEHAARRDHRLVASSGCWSFVGDLPPPAMDRPPMAVAYGCYDPSPATAAATFLSSPAPAVLPPAVYRHRQSAAEVLACPPGSRRQTNVDVVTPPYFAGDRHRRFLPDVADGTTTSDGGGGVYAGMSMQYGADTGLTGSGSGIRGTGLCSPPDDRRDCGSFFLAADALVRTPAGTMAPPPSMFAWRAAASQAGCLSSSVDHKPVGRFPSYYTNMVVEEPFCRSPVGADCKSSCVSSLKNRFIGKSASTVEVFSDLALPTL